MAIGLPDEKPRDNSYQKPTEDIQLHESYVTWIKDRIQKLDERAKLMIITCAGLIVIHFGLLLTFTLESNWFMVTPEYFFISAVTSFSISLYSIIKLHVKNVHLIEDMYASMMKWKLTCHYVGMGFFVIGLSSLAITIHSTLVEKSDMIEVLCQLSRNESMPTDPRSVSTDTPLTGSYSLYHVSESRVIPPPPDDRPCVR